jgi:hypothetical protein
VITIQHYFCKPHSQGHTIDAAILLTKVNSLVNEAVSLDAYTWRDDQDTSCPISGSQGGDGDGGFRTPGSRTGAPASSHRQAKAVDVYDPGDLLDKWLDTYEGENGENSKLAEHGLYRESPSATPTWCHLTTRAPGSGRRTFFP